MKKIRYIIVVFFILIFLSYLVGVLRTDFGLKYNPERLKRGIPLIGNEWRVRRNYPFAHQLWSPPYSDTLKQSYHMVKKVSATFGVIEYEYDAFILKKGHSNIRMGYIYAQESSNPWSIEYCTTNNEGITEEIEISYQQAVDTLKKYKLFLE